MKRGLTLLILMALLAGVFAVGLLDHRQRSLVDWSSVRAVAIQSDDWGLCGFVPNADALAGLDRDVLGGTRFPPAYWNSTLEDSTDVADMTALLLRHRGRDGLPAVFQPNMIMGFHELGPDGIWRTGRIRDGWARGYERPGLWRAVAAAVRAGVWAPELHGLLHYDPKDREARVADAGPGVGSDVGSDVAEAARRGVLVFPGAQASFELGPDRSTEELAYLWRSMIEDQAALFGRRAVSVVAPDYVWDDRHERMWASAGLRCIQAKRSQRRKDLSGPEAWRRVAKYAERQWDLWTVGDLCYLERNCKLETAQSPAPDAERLLCAEQARKAWRQGRPAIIEAHRVNFVQTDDRAEREGRAHLDRLLDDLDTDRPLYADDAELTAWTRRGVSVDRRGDRWILRNPGPGARLAVLPSEPVSTVLVPPMTVILIDRRSRNIIDRISLH